MIHQGVRKNQSEKEHHRHLQNQINVKGIVIYFVVLIYQVSSLYYNVYSGRGGSVMSVKKNKVDDDSDDLTRDLEDPISEPNISEINVSTLSQVKTGMFLCFFQK